MFPAWTTSLIGGGLITGKKCEKKLTFFVTLFVPARPMATTQTVTNENKPL